VVWQVQDQGSGVAPATRCSQLPDQADAACGRGLFLIHQCFDDVRWSARGNRVQVAVRRVAAG
jgi:anti-sigma regulatory factor (Ser/Thr protein kinase)